MPRFGMNRETKSGNEVRCIWIKWKI